MEYITANGIQYGCIEVNTTVDTISFRMEGNAEELKEAFLAIGELEVSSTLEDTPYGQYKYLRFCSATINSDDTVTITMHIMSDMEVRVLELEKARDEQQRVIAMLVAETGIEVDV